MFLGIDIGTTSICAVVLDSDCNIVYTTTKPNDFHSKGENGERTQNPEQIYLECFDIYQQCFNKFSIKSVGISGQMHGILYVDENGKALSPLFSWQDERGNAPYNDSTYSKILSTITGCSLSSGFGATSIYFDVLNNVLPPKTTSFCTIGDYVAMRLANKKQVLMHETNAASVGLYDIISHKWGYSAINQAKLPSDIFPKTTLEVQEIGKTGQGVSVFCAIGDNQASVYGSDVYDNSVIVNIGTGSQVSVISNEYHNPPQNCEIRPYFNGKYLILGCALCGGHAYKLLKDFYNSISEKEITYEIMNDWAKKALEENVPFTNPLFKGTRSDPNLKASITGINEKNFNAECLTLSVLKGISAELKEYYLKIVSVTSQPKNLIASGNAIRLNPVLRKIVETDFQLKLNVPTHSEEAAFGAAVISAQRLTGSKLKKQVRYL